VASARYLLQRHALSQP